MLNIIQNDFKTSETTFLDEDKVNLVVESVIETIKKGLPEEAQTVEALEFITVRIKESERKTNRVITAFQLNPVESMRYCEVPCHQ